MKQSQVFSVLGPSTSNGSGFPGIQGPQLWCLQPGCDQTNLNMYHQLFHVSVSCPQSPIQILVDQIGCSANALSMNDQWDALPIHHLDSEGHLYLSVVSRLLSVKDYKKIHPKKVAFSSLFLFSLVLGFPFVSSCQYSHPLFLPSENIL